MGEPTPQPMQAEKKFFNAGDGECMTPNHSRGHHCYDQLSFTAGTIRSQDDCRKECSSIRYCSAYEVGRNSVYNCALYIHTTLQRPAQLSSSEWLCNFNTGAGAAQVDRAHDFGHSGQCFIETPSPSPAPHVSTTTCPEKYPKCQYWYCVIASCASSSCSWSRAPTRDTEPAGTYTYISGYDATGSHCTGDFPLEVSWYVAAAEQSCSDMCASVGLTCDEETFHAHMSEVDSDGEMQAMVQKAGFTCASFDHDFGMHPAVPSFRNTSRKCFVPSSDRALSSVDCAHVTGARRLCYCDRQAQAAGPTCSSLSSASASSFSGQNVAARDLGSVPFGSSSLQGYCSSSAGGKGIKFTGIHCWANINDGHLGNSHSWIPGGSGPHFVGVVFAEQKNIAGLRISRKGAGTCCDDRIAGSYTVQYTLASGADHETPDSSWTNLGTFSRSTHGFEYFSFCREIRAAALRIVVTDRNACIDELELYEEPTPEPTPDPTPEPTPERPFLQQLAESNSSHDEMSMQGMGV